MLRTCIMCKLLKYYNQEIVVNERMYSTMASVSMLLLVQN